MQKDNCNKVFVAAIQSLGTRKKNESDITPNPGGHRPQLPCAQGRTCAEQE